METIDISRDMNTAREKNMQTNEAEWMNGVNNRMLNAQNDDVLNAYRRIERECEGVEVGAVNIDVIATTMTKSHRINHHEVRYCFQSYKF